MGIINESNIIVAGYGTPCILGIQVLFSLGLGPNQISLVTHSADERNLPSWNFAKANHIEVVDFKASSEELLLWMNQKKPSILISLHYRDRMPATILSIPEYGGINLHPSLLPDYKGCFSIPWAIINGEKRIGFTYHYMVEQFDEGNIIYQEEIPIQNDDTAFSLFHKLILKGVNSLDLVLKKIIEENDKGTRQPPAGKYYSRKVPFVSCIDLEWDNSRVERFIRAMYFPPLKGAVVKIGENTHEVKSLQGYINLRETVQIFMLYISSTCSKQKKIGDAIRELAEQGYLNIELSGGTIYYDEIEDDIFSLKKEYNLNFLIHNYFPPSRENFVLNFASLDDPIYYKSLDKLIKAIKLSRALGADVYGFHAGFYIDPKEEELGKPFIRRKLNNAALALNRFSKGYNMLISEADNISLYVENNVYSYTNCQRYNRKNPFMLTSYEDYLELKRHMEFNLLLDVAHLYVSARSLDLDFEEQFDQLFSVSDYIHLSENDGLHDQNGGFTEDNHLFKIVSRYNFSEKIVTLEIYDDLEALKESFIMISAIMKD